VFRGIIFLSENDNPTVLLKNPSSAFLSLDTFPVEVKTEQVVSDINNGVCNVGFHPPDKLHLNYLLKDYKYIYCTIGFTFVSFDENKGRLYLKNFLLTFLEKLEKKDDR
jgi:hypothetical protein